MDLILQQKQTLKMVMTTELRQAIELLQMSTYDLYQFIQKQAEENPFLEVIESDSSSYQSPVTSSHAMMSPDEVMRETLRDERSMHEELMEQVMAFDIPKETASILEYLVYNIDEDGYLDVDPADVLEMFAITTEEYEEVKYILQQLEPIGIGAENLQECLLIQAKKLAPSDHVLHALIEEHLYDIANMDLAKIAEALQTTETEIMQKIERLKTLHPKPVSMIETAKEEVYVEPDIIIEYDEEKDDYTIRLNDYYIPNISFNRTYANELKQEQEVTSYIQQQFKKFEWLQSSLEKRRTTILKIMKVLIQKQKAFLQRGFIALRPLTLNHVAEMIEMHESTVSRATANKMILTPIGMFELRSLFSTALQTKEGDSVSKTKVKLLIQEMIYKENKQAPLSDQKIANLLQEQSVVISRRTVAKYRKELGILSSSKRRTKE